MTREEVMSKIVKLMALAGDECNEHEAATAAEMARKLMQKYDIEMHEVEGGREEKKKVEVEEGVTHKDFYHKWEIQLASAMRLFLPVECLLKSNAKGQWHPVFIGCSLDVAVVLSMYDYIRKAIWREGRKQTYNKATRSFCLGATETIRRRFEERKREEAAKAKASAVSEEATYALICVDKEALINQYLEEHYTTRKSRPVKQSKVDFGAYLAGVEAGKHISLQPQIK